MHEIKNKGAVAFDFKGIAGFFVLKCQKDAKSAACVNETLKFHSGLALACRGLVY